MRSINVILFLLMFTSTWGQDFDTVYSDHEHVRISVAINYSNCYNLEIDTVYYWEYYSTDPNYGILLHRTTNKLIAKRWTSSDTNYYMEYYPSGNIKLNLALFRNRNYVYHTAFYESGEIKTQREYLSDLFYKQTRYYKNGNKKSEAYYCEASPNPWNEYLIYYPSGQLSARKTYTTYHDSLSHSYHETQELSAVYFNEKGRKIAADRNSLDYMEIAVQPKWEGENPVTKIDDTTYTYDQFSGQSGYDSELLELKNAIQQHLELPTDCDCKKGVTWIGFVVSSNGSLSMVTVDFPDKKVKKQLEQAIKKLAYWPPAHLENDPVSVYVYTYLLVDEE